MQVLVQEFFGIECDPIKDQQLDTGLLFLSQNEDKNDPRTYYRRAKGSSWCWNRS